MKTNSYIALFLSTLVLGVNAFSISSKPLGVAREPTSLHLYQFVTPVIAGALSRPVIAQFVESRLPEVLEGVNIPKDAPIPKRISDVITLNLFSNVKTVNWILKSGRMNELVANKPKIDGSLEGLRKALLKAEKIKANVPSSSYKYFGSPNNRANELIHLLKSNTFAAQALTEHPDGGFELKSFDPEEINPSRYLKMMRTLTSGAGHRVNFKFDKNMNIESFTLYDDILGLPVQGDLHINKYASSAIYNLLFYSSCVHSVMHVLHFLTTTALEASCRKFPQMDELSAVFDANIAIKYVEVGLLLIGDKPKDPSKADKTIITGSDGFGSSQAIRPLLLDVLNDFGQNPTREDFFNAFYNVSPQRMEEAGILKEYRKHALLVQEFADDVAATLDGIDNDKFKEAEVALVDYLKKCGNFKCKINSFSDWLSIMSLTGQMHGGTLSYTRFIGVYDIARWRNIHSDIWDDNDFNLIVGGLGTITGMEPGRHVMSAKNGPSRDFEESLQKILDKHQAKATDLKNKYQKELIQSPDFDDYGFILSDFCMENFDGKQVTMATYI